MLTMGRASEWIRVALSGTFWGGFMLIWDTLRKRSKNQKPVFSIRDALVWILGGFLFGFWSTFGWQSFRWPLVLFSAVAFAGMVIVSKLFRVGAKSHSSNNTA
jgi:hypothetical protein